MHKSLAVVVIAVALAGPAVPAQAHTTAPVVIGAGHVDVVDVEYEDGALELGLHDESVEPGVEREPSDVVLLVKRQAQTTVPADPAFAFLGAAGAKIWVLPEIQDDELLWPGLSTEELEAGVFAADTVALKVRGVTGPGRVAVWTEDAVGTPHVLANSGDGLPDVVPLTAGEHRHTSWAFQRAGLYRITFAATATLAGTGTVVSSAPATYTFVVQP
ncbi:choice-of-anchor M domain-containing protein [Actinoplanes sp. NPDC023714]|uniref:choice-of-anchor M domain-containing protein n=1 Tax=Actinoplanes sp. NPDC023714 TaxID=3154322 RepID=UPI0033E30C60